MFYALILKSLKSSPCQLTRILKVVINNRTIVRSWGISHRLWKDTFENESKSFTFMMRAAVCCSRCCWEDCLIAHRLDFGLYSQDHPLTFFGASCEMRSGRGTIFAGRRRLILPRAGSSARINTNQNTKICSDRLIARFDTRANLIYCIFCERAWWRALI
jgi:hypothetical protein